MSEFKKYARYKSAHCFLIVSIEKKTMRVVDVKANVPGRGHATGLMKLVCELADEMEMRLVLRARPNGHDAPLNQEQLEAFYAKFGFTHAGNGEMVRT